MAEEIVGLDAERARLLALECGDAGRVAGGLATEVRTALASAWLPTRSAALLSEVEFELASLRRVIDGTIDGVREADSWRSVTPSAIGGRLLTELAERALWESLNDRTGAAAIEVGPFDLSSSFRVMGRGEWRAATIPRDCESFGPGRFYTGGGMLEGPGGVGYPIVVAHLDLGDGRHYTIDADHDGLRPEVATLGGADPGWALVGYRTGVARIEADPGPSWALLTGIAVATGLDLRAGGQARGLVGVHMQAGSRARFVAGWMPAGSDVPADLSGGAALTTPEPTVWMTVDGTTAQYPISDVAGLGPVGGRSRLGRLTTAAQGDALAIGAAAGFVAARDLRSAGQRAYEVIFETHPDGRRRARVQSFTLEQGPDGPALYGWHLFVGSDGGLRQSPISYQLGDSIQPPDLLLASNRLDPEFSTRLPRAMLGDADAPL